MKSPLSNYESIIYYKNSIKENNNPALKRLYSKFYRQAVGKLKENPYYRESIFWRKEAYQNKKDMDEEARDSYVFDLQSQFWQWDWKWYRQAVAKMRTR